MSTDIVHIQSENGQELEASWYGADSDAAAVLCHAFQGERSELDYFAERLASVGINALTFNFSRGTPETPLTLQDRIDELRAAIQHVKTVGDMGRIGLMGQCFSGLPVLANAADADALVLWAPLTIAGDNIWDAFSSPSREAEAAEKGYVTLELPGFPPLYASPKMYDELTTLDREALLRGATAPTLILHGDKDRMIPLSDSEAAIGHLNKDAELKVIEGAGHRFVRNPHQFIDPSVEWLQQQLSK